MKIKGESGGFKREYIPVVIAVLILGLLITALVYTITYKPQQKEKEQEQYASNTEEIAVKTDNIVCDNNNYIEDSKKVKTSFEEILDYKVGTMDELETDLNGDGVIGEMDLIAQVLKVTITGLPDNMYLIVTNDVDDNERIFNKDSKENGVISFIEEETSEIRTYDVKVYAGEDNCQGSLFREFTFTIPRSNEYSKTVFCLQNPDLDVCAPFIYDDDATKIVEKFNKAQKDVADKKQKEQEQNKETKNETIIEKVKNNYIVVIIAVVVIAIVIIGVLVIRRRMRK